VVLLRAIAHLVAQTLPLRLQALSRMAVQVHLVDMYSRVVQAAQTLFTLMVVEPTQLPHEWVLALVVLLVRQPLVSLVVHQHRLLVDLVALRSLVAAKVVMAEHQRGQDKTRQLLDRTAHNLVAVAVVAQVQRLGPRVEMAPMAVCA
jgi:hypothetical protein